MFTSISSVAGRACSSSKSSSGTGRHWEAGTGVEDVPSDKCESRMPSAYVCVHVRVCVCACACVCVCERERERDQEHRKLDRPKYAQFPAKRLCGILLKGSTWPHYHSPFHKLPAFYVATSHYRNALSQSHTMICSSRPSHTDKFSLNYTIYSPGHTMYVHSV